MSPLVMSLISLVLFIFFWARNVFIYQTKYVAAINAPRVIAVMEHNEKYNSPLDLDYINFSSYTWSLFRMLIRLVLFSCLLYFFPNSRIIYWVIHILSVVLVILTLWMYYARKDHYKNITDDYTKEAFKPIMKASISLPVYQLVTWLMLSWI